MMFGAVAVSNQGFHACGAVGLTLRLSDFIYAALLSTAPRDEVFPADSITCTDQPKHVEVQSLAYVAVHTLVAFGNALHHAAHSRYRCIWRP